MRLIDADELKKELCEEYEAREHYIGEIMLKAIDNAPTVEIPVARWDAYCEGQKVGYEKALSERPKGEWLDIYSTHVAYECSNCHMQMPICDYFNFCSNCGADMRGDKE